MQTGIIDEGLSQALPEVDVDNEALALEKRMAKFAKSAEFKLLKDHLNNRIEFYQSFLPDGREVSKTIPTPEQWTIANGIIGEMQAIIYSFEQAAEVVKDANS